MRIASWVPSLIALALLGSPAHAQHRQNLQQVWDAALQRDPAYAAARAQRNADQEIVPQARAKLLPYISASAAGEVDTNRELRGLSQGETKRRGLWALTLTQPIIDIGNWNKLEQSQFVANSADLGMQQAYQDLILRVSQAYFDVLAAQDTLRTVLAQKQAVSSQLDAAKKGFELGGKTIADTYEAQSRLDLLNAGELQARNAVQVSEDQLAKIIYERPGALAGLASTTTLPPPQPNKLGDWTAQAGQANLAVARAQLSAKIVEKQIAIAKSGHAPTLSLYAQTGSISDRGVYGMQNGPRSLDTTVGVQLLIPIYSGGEISSQVREQTSRLQQARYDLEAARRQAVQSTQQYFSGVTSGLAQIEALQAAEKSSLASLDANKIGYEIGVRVNIDVLNAQQQLYETQRALLRARYDTLMNSLRLKASSGILSEADITAINQLLETGPAAALSR
ncbi:TolC family outer membrane protein [Eoetvoesiella caeni]|uniref:Outer membrane protein n=1 Tax=Eoetvoesiella caeni TaxID=645616 RepID=A0A366H886_9BURK|nr:TolC family outer membrane protein [Eoetvoesiella caeni]MCI2809729.1 TolC family outer membrane protein [Eoetvoesiella caeni]NYT56354.1 TolC family outer membrane protein [Eoetvoesiella caeni]RBP38413.1 outer membrane protein [Eoetvoesiella caeni]